MKVTKGLLRVKGKSYREGEDIPDGVLTKGRIEKLSAAGIISKDSKAGPKTEQNTEPVKAEKKEKAEKKAE